MKCQHCGASNPDTAKFCHKCGKALMAESVKPKLNAPRPTTAHTDTICPFCGGENCQPVMRNITKVKSSGYSLTSGCCGLCLLGPFGLLCGLCGAGSKLDIRNETMWVCQTCGKQHIAQQDAKEKLASMSINILIVTLVCALVLSGRFHYGEVTFLSLLLCIGIPIFLWAVVYSSLTDELGYPVAEILPAPWTIGKIVGILGFIFVLVLIFGGPILFRILGEL